MVTDLFPMYLVLAGSGEPEDWRIFEMIGKHVGSSFPALLILERVQSSPYFLS